ncbi:MAG: PilW family protein [Rhodocyclales bacterium]|nr:PilW family protein [Rhodocyclales bacterium]
MTNKTAFVVRGRAAVRGFSIVELLVGMVIALLATIVIMQVLTNSEAGRRATGGLTDSQTSGLLGLFAIERDLQQAGYGLAGLPSLGCSIRAGGDLDGRLLNPAAIIPDGAAPGSPENPWGIPPGDAGSDIIVVAYGNPTTSSEGSLLTNTATASPYRIDSILGLSIGEYLLIAESGANCTLGRVTATNAVDSSVTLDFGAGVNYTLQSARAYSLGRAPRFVAYAVRNGSLTVCDFLANDCGDAGSANDGDVWVPVASDVVAVVAQYGWDTTAIPDKAVDSYCKGRLTPAAAACPAGDDGSPAAGNSGLAQGLRACDWNRVLAIRVAVVSRSGQYEKDEVSPATIKLWQDSAAVPATTGPEYTPDDRHYRYRVANTTVALRNLLWMKVVGSPCAA